MNGAPGEFSRPATLAQPAIWALIVIAAAGWLVGLFFWMEASNLRAEGQESLRRAEVARQSLVGELQSLQVAVGQAAELRKKLDDGRKAVDDAVAERTRVQNEAAEIARKIDETELALANQTDQLESRTALLKDVNANLKTAQDELADLATRKAALAEELAKARADLETARAAARAADASAVAAKTAEAEARAKAEAAQAQLADLQSRLEAARKGTP